VAGPPVRRPIQGSRDTEGGRERERERTETGQFCDSITVLPRICQKYRAGPRTRTLACNYTVSQRTSPTFSTVT